MEDCDLNGREFKIVVIKKQNQIRENRQFDELIKKINEWEYLVKETETIKMN